MILNDYEMIVHKLGQELEYVNLYPLGDLHIGSAQFNKEMWDRWKKMVLDDPNGYVVIIGDLVDNGLKNSKTNSYEATMRPMEQKMWLAKGLKPLKDKILGGCQGNHENRTNVLSDGCPMYDVFAKLDLEDLYRENMAFIKINVGFKNKDRQFAYGIVLAHGASNNKVKNFSYSIDGMDLMVTGHTHDPQSHFPSKIVMDMRNEMVYDMDFTRVVVPSFLKSGGYALKNMYQPTGHKIPVVKLYGTEKKVDVLWT